MYYKLANEIQTGVGETIVSKSKITPGEERENLTISRILSKVAGLKRS